MTRADILQRYRGSQGSTTRGANAADSRIAAARQGRAESAAAARISAARSKQQIEKKAHNAGRAKAVRDASRATRIQSARQDYLGSISKRRAQNARGASITGSGAITGGSGAYTNGYSGGYHNNFSGSFHYGIGSSYWNYWGPQCSWFWGPSLYWSTYWWHCYWYNGGTWSYNYRPKYYYYGPFVPYSQSVIYTGYEGSYADVNAEVVYVESEPEVVYVEEGSAGSNVPGRPAGPSLDGLGRAADYYLSLGDRAFREARYGDAVHYYAKAVEYSPDEGILFLILADALFATGDYHYAAYSLRRALELDPDLASNVVDKHSFYSEPAAFDRQLAVLERYLEDHFLDSDARLVLAANYLFGAKPEACVDLLDSPYSKEVTESQAGQVLLNAARAVLQGDVAPAVEAVPLPTPSEETPAPSSSDQ